MAFFAYMKKDVLEHKIKSNEQTMIEWENLALYYLTQKVSLERQGKIVAAKRFDRLYPFAQNQAEKHFEMQVFFCEQLEKLKTSSSH